MHTIIKYNNHRYYIANDLFLTNRELFGNSINSRGIIEKYKISKADYAYVQMTSSKWMKTTETNKKTGKLIILKRCIDNIIKRAIEKSEKSDESDESEESIDGEDDIMDAPDIIELADQEKFKDSKGNIIEIETRGTRNVNECYFRVSDVVKGFGIDRLHDTIIRRRGYIEKDHYVYFKINHVNDVKNKKIKNKKLFLTYVGLLRVLFVSRNKSTNNFVQWASEILFAVQMGTTEQKHKVISKITGASVIDINSVFSQTNYKLPVIYLFGIGLVKYLRKVLSIDKKYSDNKIVGKFGMTIDLQRRTKEHNKTFGKMKNADLKLMHYNYIDPQYISRAEVDIKDAVTGFDILFEHKTHSELIIFDQKKLPLIKKQYDQIGRAYIGHISELVTKIEKMEITHENQLMKKQHEIDLLKKDLEIANLKLQQLTNK